MPTVTVLMSTYNGQSYLREQIDSVLRQNQVVPRILVRDDGSEDDTISILEDYSRQGLLRYTTGANVGPGLSFMTQVWDAPRSEYYAFCDQDDIWLPDKLIAAVRTIGTVSPERPSLYFSALTVVDEKAQFVRILARSGVPTLGSAMVGNPGAGCTFVFNGELGELLRLHSSDFIGTHDSWTLRVCLAVGGVIFYDSNSHILYRQHDRNVVGLKSPRQRIWRRLARYASGEHPREAAARALLEAYSDRMPHENRALLEKIASYRASTWSRVQLLRDPAFSFSSLEQRWSFYLAACLGGL